MEKKFKLVIVKTLLFFNAAIVYTVVKHKINRYIAQEEAIYD